MDIHALRQKLRAARNQIAPAQQEAHQRRAVKALLASSLIQSQMKVAVYLAQDGELGCNLLIDALRTQDCEVYLPIINAQTKLLRFGHYQQHTPFIANQYGILEPNPTRPGDEIAANELDIVFVPLVGFDQAGHRLGMGGGFYDRSFAFKLAEPHAKPLMIGWAHSIQQVEQLDAQSWDVCLDRLVTEAGVKLS
jgi:5-formyltetrahydrofolate cyclo-ligase